jgi:hypothetical protein
MPVRKFRTVAEMNGDRWYAPGDPELYRAIRRVWTLGHRTLDHRFPPGVHKHRGVEEMNAQQKRWDDANFEAYRRRLQEEKDRTK